MKVWPKKNCPSCRKEISFWTIRRKFRCNECNSELISSNYTKAMIIVLGAWGFILSPIVWVFMCCGPLVVVADCLGLVLFMGIISPKIIELNVASEVL